MKRIVRFARASLVVGLALALGLASRRAAAQTQSYSALERSVIRQALAQLGRKLEEEPEGKLVEGVDVVRLEVFDERDPVPDFFNIFHTTTRERVVRRELLFQVGSPYSAALVEESARNLREFHQLSLVILVPTRGSAPGRVRVLVITKDVWSLRLNSDVRASNQGLQYLLLNPTEENLFGLHASIGGLFILQQGSYSMGVVLSHRRVLGTRIQGSLSVNLVRNRQTGGPEGSFGSFRYGQPLYSLTTEWAWGSSFLWQHDVSRRYIGASLAAYSAQTADGGHELIPIVYARDRLYGGYEVTRSFGRRFKYDLTFGVEADRRAYHPQNVEGRDPSAVRDFERNVMPVSDQRVSPFFQLHAHENRYLSFLEVETLGLQEDYQAGYAAVLRIYPASSELSSTRSLLGIKSALSYTAPLPGGLVRGILLSTIEYARPEQRDALFEAGLRLVSPRLGIGRLVLDGLLLNRYENYLNRRYGLGGDTRLRGYPTNTAVGADAASFNAEFRTASVDVLSAQAGLCAFFDAGDAADRVRDLRFKSSAGLGLRILFPQLDRVIFRADWGLPFAPGYRTFPGALFVSFEQAFAMPVLAPQSVLTELLQ